MRLSLKILLFSSPAFLCFATSNYVFCQKKFLPGYIISLKGDTAKGFIDYQNWDKSPKRITFSTSQNGKAVSYKPNDIEKFSVADELYVSAIVETDNSLRDVTELSNNEELKLQRDTAFLQTLMQDEKSLYRFKPNVGVEHFFIGKSENPEWLVYKLFLKEQSDGKTIVAANTGYMSQVLDYLGKCSTVQKEISEIKYERNSLQSIFKSYSKCIGSKMPNEKKPEKAIFETGLLAGISNTKLNFTKTENVDNSFRTISNADYSTSTNFSGGIYLNIVFPQQNKKFSLYNELLYSTFNVEGTYSEDYSFDYYGNYYNRIGFSYLKLNTMFRYYLPVASIRVFINAGMSNGLTIQHTLYQKEDSRFITTITQNETSQSLNNYRSHEEGFLLGAGVQKKRFSLNLRLEMGSGILDVISSTRYFILLGYKL